MNSSSTLHSDHSKSFDQKSEGKRSLAYFYTSKKLEVRLVKILADFWQASNVGPHHCNF